MNTCCYLNSLLIESSIFGNARRILFVRRASGLGWQNLLDCLLQPSRTWMPLIRAWARVTTARYAD